MKAIAGNVGQGIKSDCQITLQIKRKGGLVINVNSKVKELFGKSIYQDIEKVMKYFEIKNAEVIIEDSGALPFVIYARLEAAIKQAIKTDKEYLPEIIEQNIYTTAREDYRFSRLYLPGNNPKMMINAGIHKPNGIILDLEDSVAPQKKDEARLLIRNALRQVDFYGAERMVRINQGDRGIEDLRYVVPHYVNLILIPKCESAEYVHHIDNEIERIREEKGIKYPVYYMPIIESALGVENAFDIAMASKNVVAMAIGLEDFTADLGVKRTNEGTESLYARMRLVNACKAAGIQPIDSVFSDVGDMDALYENVKSSKALGFEGMGCIHPRQIEVIHNGFAPEEDEIEKAKKIVIAFDEAEEKGLGVVSLGSKMIDPPVVKRAQKTIDLALSLGILARNWKKKVR